MEVVGRRVYVDLRVVFGLGYESSEQANTKLLRLSTRDVLSLNLVRDNRPVLCDPDGTDLLLSTNGRGNVDLEGR